MHIRELHEENRAVRERAALIGYAGGAEAGVDLIRSGGTKLVPAEIAHLKILMDGLA